MPTELRPFLRPRTILGGLTFVSVFSVALPAAAQDACFTRLDTGIDTAGWHKSTTNHHGPGDGWTFENGDLVGRQTGAQLGGILMTDKTFMDAEVVFEVKIDWGCDSGMFFRTTAGDRAYQVNVDHLDGASVGSLYGESFTVLWRVRPYLLSNNGLTATVDPASPVAPIFDLTKWSAIWNPTGYNSIRARVEGNPPHIQVWISSVKVMDATDSQLRSEIDPSGPLAIQVHGGARWTPGGAVRYRNIWAKDLTIPCTAPVEAGVGDAAAAQPDSSAGGSGSAGSGGGGGASGSAGAGSASGASSLDATSPVDSAPPVEAAASSGAGSGMSTAPAGGSHSGGCACRVAPPNRTARHAPLLLLFLALARLRTRVRSRRRCSSIPRDGERHVDRRR